MKALVGAGVKVGANSLPTMNASGGPAAPSASHNARAPGTDIRLGRSTTPGRAKIDAASSSRCSGPVGCWSSWVWGLVGVVVGREPDRRGRGMAR